MERKNIPDLLKHFSGKLRVRVCGVLVKDEQLLLVEHRGFGPKGKLYIPPGGGLEVGESAEACLKREFMEETGLDIEVGKFLFIHEFIQEPLHAIELFFSVKHIGGNLSMGYDPEIAERNQILTSLGFYSHEAIELLDPDTLHSMLRMEPDPLKFEHLNGFYKFALNS